MKTSELIGPALDWAVAKCEFEGCEDWDGTLDGVDCVSDLQGAIYAPSTNWEQGGPIIERERIRIDCPWNPGPFEATCKIDGVTGWCEGPTILAAAMRCYCCAKLGDEIDIPEELQPCQQPNL